jgi:transposase
LRKNYDKICRKAYSRKATYSRLTRAKRYLGSWYKYFVFWQINAVYRKLWQVAREDPESLPNFIKKSTNNLQKKGRWML